MRQVSNFIFILIRLIDDLCHYVNKTAVLVLDNAPTRRSEKFFAAIERWTEPGLSIFFLPKCSPHLKLAETFWRKDEYEWLRLINYDSPSEFKKIIKYICNNIKLEYKIQFHQMIL